MKIPLVVGGKPTVLIVVGEGAPKKEQCAAEELQRYSEKLASARLRIVTPEEALKEEGSLLLLGRLAGNELISGVRANDFDIAALNPAGFILCSVEAEDRPAIAVMAGDEMWVLYGVYALLQELGTTFPLSGDPLLNLMCHCQTNTITGTQTHSEEDYYVIRRCIPA